MIILLYLTTILHFVLGLYLLVKDVKNKVYLAFSASLIGISLWSLSNAQFADAPTASGMVFWALFSYNAATFMLAGLVFFSKFISDSPISPRYLAIYGFIIVSAFVMPYIPGFIFTGVDVAKRSILPGAALPLIFLTDIILIVSSLTTLFRGIKRASNIKRQQLRIVTAGILLASIFGFFLNAVLPGVGNYDFVTLGPAFTLVFLSLVAYSIVRHRFLDIRVLIGRIVYYLVASALPYVLFFGLATVYISIFGTIFHPAVYIISIIVGLIFVFAYNEFNKFIRHQVTSRFINPGFDPLESAEVFATEASFSLDIKEITNLTIETFRRTIRPEKSATVIFSNNDRIRTPLVFSSSTNTDVNYSQLEDIFVTLWSNTSVEALVYDYIDELTLAFNYPNTQNLVRSAKEAMAKIGAKVALPLQSRDKVTGMIIVGSKEADSPYTEQEVDFLKSLATTASVAIERSLLYSEVQDFANTLQDKVDEATADLQEANQSLQKALRQLQEVRRRERDMIDVMGHELRTPMSIVRNALSLLEREYEKSHGEIDSEKLKKYLDMGVESARREIDLIETLLSATKIDASRIQLHLIKVDHKDVVDDAIEGQKSLLTDKSLQLIYTPPAQDIFSFCDRTRVQQIMDNFLSNSVKYTQQGSVEIKAWNDADNAWISISDTGIGIDAEDLHNLGKKFFRAKQYISSAAGDEQKIIRPGGTGLGLYVTFELIRIMGGQLYINSEVNKGTTFTWSMPVFKGQEEQQIDQTFDTTDTTQRQHIYINQPAPTPK